MRSALRWLPVFLSLLPVLWIAWVLVAVVTFALRALQQGGSVTPAELPFTMAQLPFHLSMAALHVVEVGLCLRHMSRNPRLGREARIGWITGLCLVGVLVVPAYCWREAVRGHAPAAAP